MTDILDSPYNHHMKMERFSPQTQDGLRLWCQEAHGVEPSWLNNLKSPDDWAWLYFLLKASEDRVEWFPRGKWATLQHLESILLEEAGPLVGRPLQFSPVVRDYRHAEEAAEQSPAASAAETPAEAAPQTC